MHIGGDNTEVARRQLNVCHVHGVKYARAYAAAEHHGKGKSEETRGKVFHHAALILISVV